MSFCTHRHSTPLSESQLWRLFKSWLDKARLDPALYGLHSLRRTLPTHIHQQTGNLRAAQLMHILTARIGDQNAVVISHKILQKLMDVRSVTTVKTALKTLEENRWIEIRQIGQNGTVNAYVINDRVAWTKGRDGLRYSLFSAAVVLSEEEQPDRDQLSSQEPLRRLPGLFRDEQQLPSGPGLEPPSQPFFDGMEPDLPARRLPDPSGQDAQ